MDKKLLFCSENEKKRSTADDRQYEAQSFFAPICCCEYINYHVERVFLCTKEVFFFRNIAEYHVGRKIKD